MTFPLVTWREKLRWMLIASQEQSKLPLFDAVEQALEGGFTSVQLREPGMSARELYDAAIPLRRLTRNYDALLIINDRLDVALAIGADGAHLGWRSLKPDAAKRASRGRLIIGCSAHNEYKARTAVQLDADYLTLSPIFPTESKDGLGSPLGTEHLQSIVESLDRPVIALGGVNSGNVCGCFNAGAHGIALIRSVLTADDPKTAAHELIHAVAI
ncbi:thiamine phosphate synthase [Candidatus Sumerlaeota bacterium]|nr:thiamine phosphate synthase [Candidatus Sumerlaeota bacterium]